MPTANSIPMSSMVAGSSPPNSDNDDNENYDNNRRDGVQEEQHSDMQHIVQGTPHSLGLTAFREQEQDQHYGTDSEADDYDGGPHSNDDDYNVDDDEDEVDTVYVADLLRQSGIDWMQYPEYATHQMLVTSIASFTSSATTATVVESEARRLYFRVMAQFLIPASAVFRDFLLAEEDGVEEDEHDEEDGQEAYYRSRLGCLRYESHDDTEFLEMPVQSTPAPPSLPHDRIQPLAPFLPRPANDQENPDTIEPLPRIHLTLRHPEHFPGLLQVMYDMDLQSWEETHFRPETIAAITETVSRLECSTALTLHCLEYYRKIKSILTVDEFSGEGGGGGALEDEEGKGEGREMEELKRLYKAAVENGMLLPDPDL
ncbi:hypothetical protein BGX23_004179 [Mortierella sp. AD031]|nr:hypothetical protein BGX23_004179 [Mortierella sp. AD031]